MKKKMPLKELLLTASVWAIGCLESKFFEILLALLGHWNPSANLLMKN
jgi:hypothetical protein